MKTKLLQTIIFINIIAILSIFYVYYVDATIKAYTWSLLLLIITLVLHSFTPKGKHHIQLIKASLDDVKTYSLPLIKTVNYQTFFIIVIALFMASFVLFLDNILRLILK